MTNLLDTGKYDFLTSPIMARPRRINFPHSLFHVFSRTNSGDRAFLDHRDCEKFLAYLSKYTTLFEFRVHAWCLMDNHFHLLLESNKQPALSELMRRLLTAYTVYFNRRHNRHGHLFQGRFKSLVVDKSDYLLSLSRYIHTNPFHKDSSIDPVAYEWSSLKYYSRGGEPPFLCTDEILSWFEGDREQYLHFIREGLDKIVKPVVLQQRYVGGEQFTKRMNLRLKKTSMTKSRATQANERRQLFMEESEDRKASAILRAVADYFSIDQDIWKQKKYARGDSGRARCIAAALLRHFLPWTCRRIEEYMGLAGGYYRLEKKLKKDDRAGEIFALLKEHLTSKV